MRGAWPRSLGHRLQDVRPHVSLQDPLRAPLTPSSRTARLPDSQPGHPARITPRQTPGVRGVACGRTQSPSRRPAPSLGGERCRPGRHPVLGGRDRAVKAALPGGPKRDTGDSRVARVAGAQGCPCWLRRAGGTWSCVCLGRMCQFSAGGRGVGFKGQQDERTAAFLPCSHIVKRARPCQDPAPLGRGGARITHVASLLSTPNSIPRRGAPTSKHQDSGDTARCVAVTRHGPCGHDAAPPREASLHRRAWPCSDRPPP